MTADASDAGARPPRCLRAGPDGEATLTDTTPPPPMPLDTLLSLARQDRRPRPSDDVDAAPSVFTFVAHDRERIAGVGLSRPALVLILEGGKELLTMGRHLRFAAGTALVLPAGWRGDVVNIPDPRSGFYRALFLDFAEDLVISAHRAHPDWQPRDYVHRLALPLDGVLLAAIEHAATGIAAGGLPRPLAEHRIMEILLILGMRGALPLRPHAIAAATADAVRLLVRWQPERRWTANDIARELGMSNATLRRRLAREQATLRGVLTDERMSLAAALIEQGGTTLRDAALATGYVSVRRFSERLRRLAPASADAARRKHSR
ncbi:helix-turn-helix transcriptional regulator [Burkholderia ubonensis]|uniref:helix-turn-helix transcriptional regulator n=1 Tax=Burkholderia ubonensis TaxID=101571 RepID=UPI000B16CE64|nr:helix-turn-helix domain-containing protein [Burkholderia ubonensis]